MHLLIQCNAASDETAKDKDIMWETIMKWRTPVKEDNGCEKHLKQQEKIFLQSWDQGIQFNFNNIISDNNDKPIFIFFFDGENTCVQVPTSPQF